MTGEESAPRRALSLSVGAQCRPALHGPCRLVARRELGRKNGRLTRESPFLPTGHPFTNVQADFYWSATTFGENPALAWGGGFENNLTEPGARFTDKTFQFYVWCVRSGLAGADVQ